MDIDQQSQALLNFLALDARYQHSNLSDLEWVLDQCNEKKPRDPIITEKFNTCRIADHD